MSKNYIPVTPEIEQYKTLTYSERKRIRDREIAAMARMILKDQKTLSRTEATRMATSLYDTDQTYTPINSTTENTTESSAENITEAIELEMHVTQGPRTVEPSNRRFANLQKPANGADNPTKNAVQTNANQA